MSRRRKTPPRPVTPPPAAPRLFTPELFVLTALSAFTHFWRLFTPSIVVFDEKHFKEHAGHYLAQTYYFDVHPPLAKLLYALEAKVAGISAASLLGPDPAVALRVLPAFLGTLIVPLAFVILRQLGAGRRVAALGAFAVLCDNALLVDARFALIEPILIAFGLLALALYLASRDRHGRTRWALVLGAAFMAGCALSAKWTGASALGVILVAWVFDVTRRSHSVGRTMGEGALLVAIPCLVYVGSFAVHFGLLTRTGVGDTSMPPDFQATLLGSPLYDARASMPLITEMEHAHHAMEVGNEMLQSAADPWQSPWYTWPLMRHPIWFAERDHPASHKQIIALLGNPVVWWGSLAVVVGAVVGFWRRRNLFRRHRSGLLFLGGGFLINYVPFTVIHRPMYLYHYLFGLVFLILLAVYALGILSGWNDDESPHVWRFSSRRGALLYGTVAVFVLAGFVYFLPFTYGWTQSPASYEARYRVLRTKF